MELICGACQGRLFAESPGTTVACPHCGAHLQTPAAQPDLGTQEAILSDSSQGPATGPLSATNSNSPTVPDPWSAATTTSAGVPPSPVASELADATGTAPASPSESADRAGKGVDSAGAPLAAEHADTERGGPRSDDLPGETGDDPLKTTVVGFAVPVGGAATSEDGAAIEAVIVEPDSASGGTTESVSAIIRAAESSEFAGQAIGPDLPSLGSDRVTPADNASGRQHARAGVSPMIFLIVVSYASATTLACVYLAFLLVSNPRTLDLPDLAPPQSKDKKKVTSLIYLSPHQEVPPANVLKLGESRQYGSLRVTPLRVTRGPLEFEYYETEAEQTREPEGPVLKLHLRFENVSNEQEFAPLDSRLVFTKEIDRKTFGSLKANNFVCNVADRKDPSRQVFVFDLTPNGNWLLKGENLDRLLAPGQAEETYIPTTPEQIDSLTGDLVWRVHFRKGYNPKSLRGVTTLIEVRFKGSDILNDELPPDSNSDAAAPVLHGPAEEDRQKPEPTFKDA
jgi:hypothetical protein